MDAMQQLKERLAEINNLNQAGAVLGWDQRTYMPPKGAESRARQLATLAKLAHERFVDVQTQELLAAAQAAGASLPADSDDAALLRVTQRDLDKALKVPTSLVVALTETCTLAEEHWAAARARSDYPAFAPWLEKILGLKRAYADCIGWEEHIYDALLDDYEQDMTVAQLGPLLADLRAQTVPLVQAIAAHADRVSAEVLTRDYDETRQEAFARRVIAECGFPADRGRLDRTVHPFCTNFSPNDVRITTRYERDWLPGALFGCLHEMGHAFYELNQRPELEGTPLCGGVSLGVHESQSRLWENQVGRSRGFWQHYYPALQQAFPAQLAAVPVESFYKAINRVTPSLIRVEADEVTYNLHIILRYEMENDLLEKKLSVADAPAAWNEKMHSYLGITPPTDREGILQDIHWSGGGIGYFPTYTLGNILAAQLFAKATAEKPAITDEIRAGRFATLYEWLRVNVHQHGRKYAPAELVRRATGERLTIGPYVKYLREKFGEAYGL